MITTLRRAEAEYCPTTYPQRLYSQTTTIAR
jgi:hypothetical protein